MSESFPKVYVSYGKDTQSRLKSSSGSICYLLSRYIIGTGGRVSGVAFDDEYGVVRRIASSLPEIDSFRGSKYVQADQNDSFRRIKDLLEDNEMVLFIGTPCQVGGLKCFLQKDYYNLVCVDFLCLGVPSPIVWKSYMTEEADGRNISEIVFKDKRNGWKKFTFKMAFQDSTEIAVNGRDNPFMKNMIGNLYNRPSCHHCRYRKIDRPSDITVADAWGMDRVAPELLDNLGTSSVIIRSEKGMRLFRNIEEELVCKEISLCDFKEGISGAWQPTKSNEKRDAFFNIFSEKKSFFGALEAIEDDT